MKELVRSYEELEKAQKKLLEMRSAATLLVFKEVWGDFLSTLEKIWNKSERECQNVKNQFMPWQGKYKSIRKTDQVLMYLKNARDADTHSLEETIQQDAGGLGINATDRSKPLIIRNLTVKNGNLSIEASNQPLEVTVYPSKIKLVPFVNSGRRYFPPLYFRKEKLADPTDPISVAEKGVTFYEQYLVELEKKLIEWKK